MNDRDVDDRFAFAKALAQEAGALALGYFHETSTLTVTSKGVQDFASEADLQVEVLIRRKLKDAFPDDGFLGEETGRDGVDPHGTVWVVDPIDGTQPFLSGLTSWCVSIALLSEDVLQFGVVVAPARNEVFAGSRLHPATLNGAPIAVRDGVLTDGLVATGYCTRVSPQDFVAPFLRLLEAGGMFFRDGSGALSLCYVACGRLIGFMEASINAWDCLGGIAIIAAAGGDTSDFLANDGLFKPGPLVAGGRQLRPALSRTLGWGD